jgi:hypothetical protein
VTLSVAQNILRLDVSVTDSFGVDVGDGSQQLVAVEFDNQVGHHLLHLQVVLHDAVGRILDVVHDHVEVDLIRFVAISVKGLAHFDTVRMVEHLEDLEFSVLVALILENFFDGDSLTGLSDGGFEYNPEGTISDDLLGVVSE